jgi:zinc transport system ATP-binding protein
MQVDGQALVAQGAGIRVELGGDEVLHGVDIAVGRGECVALLGGNGSGKTTLLRALLGLVPLSGGAARLFGADVARFGDWSKVGYVPQRGQLQVAKASVAEVVASGRLAHRRPFRLPSAADREAATGALEAVGMTALAEREMSRLSGGQRQRAIIARALASRPELIVLDEPLAGLDMDSQRGLAGIIKAMRESGLTVLVVLHEFGPLESLITRSVVLQSGHAIYDGPLLAGPWVGHTHHGLDPASLVPQVQTLGLEVAP